MQEVSRGIDRLVALASLGADWREKVLADPLAAAREAGLNLSEGERAIISSVPRAALEGMIASFEKAFPRPSGLGKLAAGAAAAALLAGTLTGCGDSAPMGKGIQPDVPPKKSGKIEPAPPATDGIRPDVPPSKPRKGEPTQSKSPNSDKALNEGIGEIPEDGLTTTKPGTEAAVFGYRDGKGRKRAVAKFGGGHRADVPAPRKKPEGSNKEESAK